MNYFKVTNLKPGVLINFGNHPKVGVERFAL
ncbi:GxxExxY protein [Desulforhopalus vacuolatus]